MADDNLADVTTAAAQPVPSSIPMPDHWVRQNVLFQLYVRLARPTLDWATVLWLVWVGVLQPRYFGKFDPAACAMAMAWAATVYGIKLTEKIKGVA